MGIDLQATREQLEAAADTKLTEIAGLLRSAMRAEKDAEAAVKRVQGDYTSGAINATDWKALRGDLEARQASAAATRKKHEADAAVIEAERGRIDGTAAAAERLANIRAAIAGETDSESGIEAVRAALKRGFENFLIAPTVNMQLTGIDAEIVALQGAEYDEQEKAAEPPLLEAEHWTIQPVPRVEIIELVAAESADSDPWLEVRPVLKPESLGKAPLSVVADRVQFLDAPGEDSAPEGAGGSGGGSEDAGERELAGAGAGGLEVGF